MESEDDSFIGYASRQQIRRNAAFGQVVFDLKLVIQQSHVNTQVAHALASAPTKAEKLIVATFVIGKQQRLYTWRWLALIQFDVMRQDAFDEFTICVSLIHWFVQAALLSLRSGTKRISSR